MTLKRQAPKFKQTADDSAVIERMLDESSAPLTNAALVPALLDGAHPDHAALQAVELRVRNVTHLLQKAGRVRSLRMGMPVGWVWNHRQFTDDEWRERLGSAETCAPTALASAVAPGTLCPTTLH